MTCEHGELQGLAELLAKLKKISPTIQQEENLFQIGGRGHYENPTSQLLEFFLDASRGHGFGSTVLDALLEAVQVNPATINTKLKYWTTHEVVTNEVQRQDRMDLVLESDAWVIVIENKIRHDAINDFDAYARFAESKQKTKVLILLSVRKEDSPAGWKSLSWKDLIEAIRSKLALRSIDAGQGKWFHFLREFLSNVESECSGIGHMDQEIFKFSETNAKELFQAQDIFQNYLNEIRVRWTNSFMKMEQVEGLNSRIERMWQWKDGTDWRCIPIRFLLQQPALEIVLKVFPSGRYGINLYPRPSNGVTQEQLRVRFSEPYQVKDEKGYLACICADQQVDLTLDEALTKAIGAIETLRQLCLEATPKAI